MSGLDRSQALAYAGKQRPQPRAGTQMSWSSFDSMSGSDTFGDYAVDHGHEEAFYGTNHDAGTTAYDTCDGTGARPAVTGTYTVPAFPAVRPEGTRAIWTVCTAHGPAGMRDLGTSEDNRYVTETELAAYLAQMESDGYEWRVSWTVYDVDAGNVRVAAYDGKAGKRTH